MKTRKVKSFKFNDTVKTTTGLPVIGAIWEVDKFAKTAIVTSFKTGKDHVLAFSVLKKITSKQSEDTTKSF